MAEHVFDHRKLSNRILLALVLGLVFGIALNLIASGRPWLEAWVATWLTGGVFRVVGESFFRLLAMLIVPIVVTSLITGVSSLSDPKVLGRVGGKALFLFALTTVLALMIALPAAVFVQPGVGANPQEVVERVIHPAPPLTQVLIEMVPRNAVEAMAQGQMLPLIVFAIMIGLAISFSGAPGERIARFFVDLNEVVMKLVSMVMLVAPFGVFALVANLGATTGWSTFTGVIKYVLLVMVLLLIHAAVVYPVVLKLFTGLSPLTFYRQMRDVLAFAFSTASSGATIPVTLRVVEKRLGVSNRVASFIVPLGATINMDGTTIMQGIATVFIAQYYGVDLSATQYLMVVVMVIMASIGTAGVPGVGLVMLAGVLTQVGLPVEGIALILGVDRILDMTRTAVNVTGDSIIAVIVARSEGELDEAVFHDLGQ